MVATCSLGGSTLPNLLAATSGLASVPSLNFSASSRKFKGRIRDKQSGSRAWRKGFRRRASLVSDLGVGRQVGLVVEPR